MKSKLTLGLVIIALAVVFVACEPATVPVPSSPEQYCNEGWTALMTLDVDTASDRFDDALEVSPTYANAHSGKGWVAITNGDFASAYVSLNEAKQNIGSPLDQPSVPYRNLYFRFYMDAWVGTGHAYYLQGEYGDAAADFEVAVRADTDADNGDWGWDWNYNNWYMKDGDNYNMTSWEVRLWTVLAHMQHNDAHDRCEELLNDCRAKIEESTDFDAGDAGDADFWPNINAEVSRLLAIEPTINHPTGGYPAGYPEGKPEF